MRRILRVLLLLLVVGYVGLIALALLSDRIIFQPQRSSYQFALLSEAGIRDVRAIILTSGNAQIAAVYLPNPAARYTLLFSHGNAEDVGDDLPMLDEFRKAGFAVFAYDYRGYGASTGTSSEKSLYEDVDVAYRYVTGSLNVAPDRVISFGRSLGCAAAIHLASTRRVGGLIVEAPFLSVFRVLTRVRLLPWDKFDNAAKIRRVHCPVLVIHGRNDRVVPWWHGEKIYQLANQPKKYLWVDGAGHNDVLLLAPARYFSALKLFAETVATGQTMQGLKVGAAPIQRSSETPDSVAFDIKPMESRTGSLWLATYSAHGKTAKFRIEMITSSKRTEEGLRLPMEFGKGRLIAEPGSDASVLLLELGRVLRAEQKPPKLKRVNELAFEFVRFGGRWSHAESGGFNADPKGEWTPCKIFIGKGEDEGQVFLNFNPVIGKGEFSIKDEEYGDIVLRELAKVL